nr:MAG TPA: hypothetical protein [Caudoviricetes sp.]
MLKLIYLFPPKFFNLAITPKSPPKILASRLPFLSLFFQKIPISRFYHFQFLEFPKTTILQNLPINYIYSIYNQSGHYNYKRTL